METMNFKLESGDFSEYGLEIGEIYSGYDILNRNGLTVFKLANRWPNHFSWKEEYDLIPKSELAKQIK